MKKRLTFIFLLAVMLIFITACKQNQLVTVTIMGESTVSEITDTSATVTGTILEVGENMQKYGHVWGETPNPDISNFKTEHTKVTESFTDKLTDLIPETKYYVRSYAKDGDEIFYEEGTEFTTMSEIQVPELVTYNVTEISFTTATCGGNITNQGESEVIVRGVCWSTSEEPTTGDFYTQDGTGTGSYPSYMTDLLDNTTYYVRAYLTNSEGTFYGEQVSFSTLDVLPTVTTGDFSSIAYTNATGTGEVVLEGQTSVTERGLCWSTSENPSVTDNTSLGGTGLGSFSTVISGLDEGGTYYVRAYATNIQGTGYGEQKQLTTLLYNGTVTDIDGNVYNAVQIGDQIWMAENLKVTQYADGTPIQLVESESEWDLLEDDGTAKAYCFYNNNANGEADIYGAMYTWAAANNGIVGYSNPSGVQGVCPDQWHLPSSSEYIQLIDYLSNNGFSGIEGTALKSTTGWSDTGNGTDDFGFNGLPGGDRFYTGSDGGIGDIVDWWCSDRNGSLLEGRSMELHTIETIVRINNRTMTYGFYVRCVKD